MQIPLIKQKMKPIRILKVYTIKKSKTSKNVPWINLSGIWLEKTGFGIGQEIKVTIREKLLVIEIIKQRTNHGN